MTESERVSVTERLSRVLLIYLNGLSVCTRLPCNLG